MYTKNILSVFRISWTVDNLRFYSICNFFDYLFLIFFIFEDKFSYPGYFWVLKKLLTYALLISGIEEWTMLRSNAGALEVFERKIKRKTFIQKRISNVFSYLNKEDEHPWHFKSISKPFKLNSSFKQNWKLN